MQLMEGNLPSARSSAADGEHEKRIMLRRSMLREQMAQAEAQRRMEAPCASLWICCYDGWSRALFCFNNPSLPPEAVSARKAGLIVALVSGMCAACLAFPGLETLLLPMPPAVAGSRLAPMLPMTQIFGSARGLRITFEGASIITGISLLPVLCCARRVHSHAGEGAWPHTSCVVCVGVALAIHSLLAVRWMSIVDEVLVNSFYVDKACAAAFDCLEIGGCPSGGIVTFADLELQRRRYEEELNRNAMLDEYVLAPSPYYTTPGFDCTAAPWAPSSPPLLIQVTRMAFGGLALCLEVLQIYMCVRARVALLSPPAGSSMI